MYLNNKVVSQGRDQNFEIEKDRAKDRPTIHRPMLQKED